MRINTNLTAMNTFTQYTKNNNKIADSVEKLSSGYAINSAADNAAGLAISEKMRAQIRGLEQASVNSQDAISLIQTAEGGLNESTEILQRMRELAVQSANDTNENEIDREALQDEFSQLQEELNNIANTTTFNKKNLLDGSLSKKQASTADLTLQNAGLSVSLGNVAAGEYTFEAVVKVSSAKVDSVDPALTATSTNDAITADVAIKAGGSLEDTSLGNGNYDIEASWNADTKEMVFTAKGDNGQTFKATASAAELKTYADDYAAATSADDKAAVKLNLTFGNGNTDAFTLALNTATTFSTSNNSTMETVAKEFSEALTVSISGGVDEKAAEYALYATMTGAEDVKLEAGMDSVSFSNGVTVSFDELTVSDVTVNENDFKKFGGDVGDADKAAATWDTKLAAGSIAADGTHTFADAATGVKSTFTVEVDNGEGLTFQIGANQGDELVINIDRMDAEYLGVSSADVLSREGATNALSAVDKALNQVASQRAYLGAMQNRLDHKIANLDTSAENLTAAEGQIRDVDMAKQMTEFTNANILSQAATAMLAQANSLPQNVLSLIG